MKKLTSFTPILTILWVSLGLISCDSNISEDVLSPIDAEVTRTLSPKLEKRLIDHPVFMKKDTLWAFDQTEQNSVVTPDHIELISKRQKAIIRGQMIGNLLELDLDGDNRVSIDELKAIADGEGTKWLHKLDRNLPYSVADKNEDGYISMTEMQLFVRLYTIDRSKSTRELLKHSLMAFDKNKDDILTRSEIESFFDDYISEEDKQISSVQKHFTQSGHHKKSSNELDQACRPAVFPNKSDQIILLRTYGGTAYSSVAVANLDDDTDVARLKIEPGTTPVYIIVTATRSTIWSIEGEVDRVAGFVSTAGRWGNTGVVGLDESIVQFIPHKCAGALGTSSSIKSLQMQRRFERIFERDVALGTQNDISFIKGKAFYNDEDLTRESTVIENGQSFITADNGIKFSIRTPKNIHRPNLYQFKPNGLAIVPIEKVVSLKPVNEYDIYPAEAGLIQLLNSGHLKHLENGTYYIHETFPRYPAGLGGSHAVDFILGKGVKNPDGSPGHSDVLSEETGLCIFGNC